MRAYMKSALPFLGVPRPALTTVLRPVFSAHPLRGRATWEATVRALYDDADYREERYAALSLLQVRAARPWHDPDAVPLLEHLVVVGAWWDLVDEVSGRSVAPLHRRYPDALGPVLRRWSVDQGIWLRRSAILGQLGSGAATDRDLLAECIEPSIGSGEFFVRKAIGWALRDLSRHDTPWVRDFVQARPQLSALSRREALRLIDPDHRDPRGGQHYSRVASDITRE
jgi:3-methyladenine DNA glycosylase AlkD